jgi:hypothetical protein
MDEPPKNEPKSSAGLTTGIAILSLIAAIAAAYFAWQANHLKDDNLSILVLRDVDCDLDVLGTFSLDKTQFIEGSISRLTMCWTVSVTNLSEDRATITKVEFVDENLRGRMLRPTWVRMADGKTLSTPWTLEPGATEELHLGQWIDVTGSEETRLQAAGINNDITEGKVSLSDLHRLTGTNICVVLDDVDNKGKCNVHYTFKATTIKGGLFTLKMGLPEFGED